MPLQDHMKLISVDDHLVEHPRVWQDRLPAKYQEAGPRVEETADGRYRWIYEDREYTSGALNAVAGRDPSEFNHDPMRFADMRTGCYDPVERIKDMDEDGQWAGLSFPTFPKFAGTRFLEGDDTGLALACTQAFNDFVVDEWCATAPDRLIPLGILPMWDVAESVAEVHRGAGKGIRAFSFMENPVPRGLPSFHTDHWDPLFSALEETDIPMCLHFGTSGQVPNTSDDAPTAVYISLMGCNSMMTLTDLLFSPVFHRHPRLKVSLSEGGIGWIPYILERADHTFERHRLYQNINQEVRPSELFAKHVFGCFISDDVGIGLRDQIGVDRILWEGDYPHSDSHWPNSRKNLAESLRDVPDEDAHRIVELNAREVFNFPA